MVRKLLGPAMAAVSAAAAGSVILLDSAACVTECWGDEDCAPPFFRCLQNTCAECLVADDCQALFGERRMCFHGTCCSLEKRGCFQHAILPEPGSCQVPLDCVMAFGFQLDDPGTRDCATNADCQEPEFCDGSELEAKGTFTSPPPYSRNDGRCKLPMVPFCALGSCSECRGSNDCVAIGAAAAGNTCCCPGAPTGGYQCEAPGAWTGCCSG